MFVLTKYLNSSKTQADKTDSDNTSEKQMKKGPCLWVPLRKESVLIKIL